MRINFWKKIQQSLIVYAFTVFSIMVSYGQDNYDSHHPNGADSGYYLVYAESNHPESQRILDVMLADEVRLNHMITELNAFLQMPYEVPIVFGDCGMENGFLGCTFLKCPEILQHPLPQLWQRCRELRLPCREWLPAGRACTRV